LSNKKLERGIQVELAESKSENEIGSKPYDPSGRSKDSDMSVDSDSDAEPNSNEDRDPDSTKKTSTSSIEKKDKFKMPDSRFGRVLFIIFFPIHALAFYCIPNIRNRPNLSKVKISISRAKSHLGAIDLHHAIGAANIFRDFDV
jgi:hypothetical protein